MIHFFMNMLVLGVVAKIWRTNFEIHIEDRLVRYVRVSQVRLSLCATTFVHLTNVNLGRVDDFSFIFRLFKSILLFIN